MRSNIDITTGILTVMDGDHTARVTLLRVPGLDGRGAYMGKVEVRGGGDKTPLRVDLTDSIRDLGDALERHGFGDAKPASLPAQLVYGGAWAPGALKRQVEYNPLKDPNEKAEVVCRRFLNLLWAALPRQWALDPTLTPVGMMVIFRTPAENKAETYNKRDLVCAARDGRLDEMALESARMLLGGGGEHGTQQA